MTELLPPERLEELLAGHVLGNLSPEEAEELKQLLIEYPELAVEMRHLQEVLEVMPYALPEASPAPALRSVLLETASGERRSIPTQKARVKRFPFQWSRAIGSIAALVVLALGVDNVHLRQRLTDQEALVARQEDVIAMLQEPNTHTVSLKGMNWASTASGSVLMTPGETNIVLVLQNLPILPKGQSYHLWSVVGSEKISWGQFNPNQQGTVFVKLSPPSSQMNTLIVTIESISVLKRPAGPMVMTSSL